MKRFFKLCLALGMAAAFAGAANASPWAEAGDRQLRSDIELLAQYGLIRGPITAWPLPWAQISSRLHDDPGRPLPAHIRLALARVKAKMPSEDDIGRPRLGIDARGASRAKIGRDFGDAARHKADVTASAEVNLSAASARVAVGYLGDDDDGKLVLDGSYLAFALGNWAIYGGWLDHWWGPGWSSSLIMSTNARPAPRVGLMRLDPRPFGTKWLSWLGPWQFNVFLGRLDDNERIIRDPYFVGMRFSFSPIDNLDIGLSRTIMLCGDGRPCGFNIWTKALIGGFGVDNPDKPGEVDPSNQLAGYDARYSFNLNDSISTAIYGQMIGEDQKYAIPNKYSLLLGASILVPVGNEGEMLRFILEHTDTVAFLTGKGRFHQYNVFYNHSRYRSGYRYHDVVMGDRYDSDSRAWYLSGMFTDKDSWTYRVAVQRANINIDNAGQNALSATKERIHTLEAGITVPSDFGTFDLEARYSDDWPNTPGVSDGKAALEAGWGIQF